MKVPEADRGVRDEAAGAKKFVYGFLEDPGIDDVRSLLGGKGAGIREMRKLGFPVPEGFTITTEACALYIESGELPEGLMDDVESHMALVEEATGQAFGEIVLKVPGHLFEEAIEEMKGERGVEADTELSADDLKELADRFKVIISEKSEDEFPEDSIKQLELAIGAVFDSWLGDRAAAYRKEYGIPETLG